MSEQTSHLPRSDSVREALQQIVLAAGALTHAFGNALASPRLVGLSSNTDVVVLTWLHYSGPQRPRELREQAGVTTGGLSNLFERLEERHLITRTRNADGDRRGAMVSLTEHGRDLAEAIADATERTMSEQSVLLRQIGDLLDSISERPARARSPELAQGSLEQLQHLARLGTALSTAAAVPGGPHEPAPGRATVVLCAAAASGGTRPRELLQLTDLSSGGVTLLLDRLEAAGLVQRTTGQAPDRHAVTITLTERGRRDLDARLDRARRHLFEVSSAFAPAPRPTPAPLQH